MSIEFLIAQDGYMAGTVVHTLPPLREAAYIGRGVAVDVSVPRLPLDAREENDSIPRLVDGELVDAAGNPVGGSIITQPVRTGNFTLVDSDSGTVIPVTGNVTVTIDASSNLTGPVEVKRYDAGTLAGVASGATLIDPSTGAAWGTLQVLNKLSSIIFVLGSIADEYGAKKFGA